MKTLMQIIIVSLWRILNNEIINNIESDVDNIIKLSADTYEKMQHK